MKIALVSFEFPPETAYGGIASYVHETSRMLADAGHLVEVFCAGAAPKQFEPRPGLLVNVVPDLDKDTFAESLLPIFVDRHEATRFDVVESAEIYADAREIRRRFPELPLVVKLHTPSFLCHRLNEIPLTVARKLRFALGALRRGRLAWLVPNLEVLHRRNLVERAIYHEADAVVSPSTDLIRVIEAEWGAHRHGLAVLPNPYVPDSHLLTLASTRADAPLLYLGRLEMRKGVTDLIDALALLERSGAPVNARFVGAPFPSPAQGVPMDQWAARRLSMSSGRYVFTGVLPRDAATKELGNSWIVVLPSRWENFPYTCLESMAAGRVVIASQAGGMSDMIVDGHSGFLVPPQKPDLLARKIEAVRSAPERFAEIGANARQRVIDAYSPAAILPRQLETYETARRRAQQRLANKSRR